MDERQAKRIQTASGPRSSKQRPAGCGPPTPAFAATVNLRSNKVAWLAHRRDGERHVRQHVVELPDDHHRFDEHADKAGALT